MRVVIIASLIVLICAPVLTAQGVRDDDSYFIYFSWTDKRPDQELPGGFGYLDTDEDPDLTLTAVRTSRAFNVYAKNGQPDQETGAPVEDHAAWPDWYANYGWDTPDADPDPVWPGGSYYFLTIDTYADRWALCYGQYPNPPRSTRGLANLYFPISGYVKKAIYNGDGTVDLELVEDGGNWKVHWLTDVKEEVILEDKKFIAHVDMNTKTGYMVPKKVVK